VTTTGVILGASHQGRIMRRKSHLAKHQLLLALLLLTGWVRARELPLRFFTTADGLADNRVMRIVTDSRGLLWICTNAGITRFDGSQFQSFGRAQGLPFPFINDLLETPDGNFWLASNGGGVILVRLSAAAASRYKVFSVSREPSTNRVNRLYRAPDGTIWAGTDGGLFRMTVGSDGRPVFARVPLRVRGHPEEMAQVWSFASDGEGSLWVGTRFGLVRMLPGGRIVSYAIREGLESDLVLSLLFTPEAGLLWIRHQSGVAIFKPPPASSYGSKPTTGDPFEDRSISRVVAAKQIPSTEPVLPQAPGAAAYFETFGASGLSWVSEITRSQAGVIHFVAGTEAWEFSAGRFTRLRDWRLRTALVTATEDHEGNLWLGTRAAGVIRLAQFGFVTFRKSDGLGQGVSSIFEDRAGALIAVSQGWRVSRFDGQRFHTVRANMPAVVRRSGWQRNSVALQDHAGDWWFATAAGLVRFSRIRRIEDLATSVPRLYTSRDGLAQDSLAHVFEDSRGNIWCASLMPGRDVLTRWDRASGRFQRYSDADGLRPFNSPTSFYEDARGLLWITFMDGGIARYEAGRFCMLTEGDGLPSGGIVTAMADHAGRLWCLIALRGLYRISDLNRRPLRPVLVAPIKEDSTLIARLAEDASGNIYAVTGRGVVRIDNASNASSLARTRVGSIYTTNDGLAGGEVSAAYTDRQGRLWVGSTEGASYYQSTPNSRPAAPQVRIGGLRIAGVEQAVSPAGEQSISGLELLPGRSQLEIDFFGISFATGDTLSYEYRLLGAGNDWNPPAPLRSVLFSNLAPGKYEFEVRAVTASGQHSPQPARVAFRVLPPFWRSWWFLTLVGLLLATSIVAFERNRAAHAREIARAREERLVELEKVRQRIAADLHDEIGSSLTQISILSEVAHRQGAAATPELIQPLSAIASSSRELVDAMSDIVWAVNPAKDHLSDLSQRMRREAADAFTAANIAFHLELPPPEIEIKMGANLRRELFLIFKEGINNMVKHSGCSEAAVRMAIQEGVLRLEVRDNGRGFDSSRSSEGHGLTSLRRRASALGGTLAIVSAPGAGTAVTLDLPLPT
jgi:signal transduction histidine kinase/ligand-binding sensor domain-containing protein